REGYSLTSPRGRAFPTAVDPLKSDALQRLLSGVLSEHPGNELRYLQGQKSVGDPLELELQDLSECQTLILSWIGVWFLLGKNLPSSHIIHCEQTHPFAIGTSGNFSGCRGQDIWQGYLEVASRLGLTQKREQLAFHPSPLHLPPLVPEVHRDRRP
ncbi:hypothetical protein STEG23_012536, partial [Scotinomys teguina]